MLEDATRSAGGGGDAVGEGGAIGPREDVEAACAEPIAVQLESVERALHGRDVEYERLERERVVVPLAACARQHKDPEVRRVARLVGNRLRADDALARRQVNVLARRGAQALGALEREHVRRIGHDLGATQAPSALRF